jgi:flagellar basal body-associated protein FliL
MASEKKAGYGGYGKRPLWQWILLYVVIGGVLYAAVYYFFFANKQGYSYSTGSQSTNQSPYNYNQ